MSDQASDQFPEPGDPGYEEWLQTAKDKSLPEKAEAPKTVTLKGAEGLEAQVAPAELRELSLDQLQSFFGASLVDSSEAIGTDQYGPVLDTENKAVLLGRPCLFVHWNFYQGDVGTFVSAWVLTRNDDGSEQRYILNDGSTGICLQLRELTDKKGIDSGLLVRHGLRVSTYDKETPDGKVLKDCKTYYIDTKL